MVDNFTEDDAMREIVADLTGEMLYYDQETLNRLVAEQPTLWQRIANWFDNIIAKFNGINDPEIEQMKQTRAMFETALQEANNTQLAQQGGARSANVLNTSGRKYSLVPYSERQISNWSSSKSIVIVDVGASIKDFVSSSLHDKQYAKKLYFGSVGDELAADIYTATKLNVKGYNCALHADEIRKTIASHGNEDTEAPRGQRPISNEDFSLIPVVMSEPDAIYRSGSDYKGKPAIVFEKTVDGSKVTVVAVVSDKHLDIRMQTMYAGIKKEALPLPTFAKANAITSETTSGTVSNGMIAHIEDVVNTPNSLPVQTADGKPVDGVEYVDENRDSVAQDQYSLTTWRNNTNKEQLVKTLQEAGFKNRDIRRWMDDVDSVASVIAASKNLDYTAYNTESNRFMRNNQEYFATLDASTLCAKRLIYQGTFNAIQERLKNTPLLADDIVRLRQMMKEAMYETPCAICYVESRRKDLGKYAKDFLDLVKREQGKTIEELKAGDINPETGKKKTVFHVGNLEYVPTVYDLTTTDGLTAMMEEHPETAAAWTKFASSKGSANPKVVQRRTAYDNDIARLTDSVVEAFFCLSGI